MTLSHPPSVLAYFERVGAEALNFHRAMVKVYKGHYYLEKAIIRLHPDGRVTCNAKEHAPFPEELEAMAAELQAMDYPRPIRAKSLDGLYCTGPMFVFYDQETREIIMVQERVDDPIMGKRYLPWVLMTDGKWACFEPDEKLPFWKPLIGCGAGARIMIHEGAKAASFVTDLLADPTRAHPWREFLSQYEHWGMIGGALAPQRTNYSELTKRNPFEVIYACDHDRNGEGALQKVSDEWKRSMKGLIYGDDFPKNWDLADDMPAHLFAPSGRYIGPSAKSLTCPATWATNIIPAEGKGRPTYSINLDFGEEWMHSISPEVFVHRDWPSKVYTCEEFDNKVRPFSNTEATSKYLKKEFCGKANVIKYDPGLKAGLYSGTSSGRYINTYCDAEIVEEDGDATVWHDFLEFFIPDEKDRHQVKRWCATLIAHPEIRMNYGILLVSETQGVGKGTLGEKILAPLVGDENVSYPSEQTIVDSNYNYWLAHKRLAVVHEIYAGNSSKAYNKLKSIITDKNAEVSKKYQATYIVECWIHIFACSNSKRALKIAQDDRRWFIPTVTENKRSQEYWEQFNRWLTEEGGLKIIKHWAKEFTKDPANIVQAGAVAPSSKAKSEVIREGYSVGQTLVENTLIEIQEMIDEGKLPRTTYILDLDLVRLIRDTIYDGRQNEHLERPATVRAVATKLGWTAGHMQAQISGWGRDMRGARVLSLDPEIAVRPPSDLDGSKVEDGQRLKPFDLRTLAQL